MALTEDQRRERTPLTPPPAPNGAAPRGFRPASRRRTRMAVGAVLVAVAVGGNLLLYTGLDQRTAVLQAVRDVPAGTQITADDLREVEVAADASVLTLGADAVGWVVGSHARVRIVSGSLVVAEALQAEPLVTPGAAVVAVQVPDGALPVGLRERSRVRLVVPPPRNVEGSPPEVIEGRTVGLPSSPQSVSGRVSLSVEVAEHDAPLVAASDDVRVVLVDPGDDIVTEAGTNPSTDRSIGTDMEVPAEISREPGP